jgi:hypothetical protein
MDGLQALTTKLRSLERPVFALMAVVTWFIAIAVHGELAANAAKLQGQMRIADEWKAKANQLLKQKRGLHEAIQRESAIFHDWLDKVAVPREAILKTARIDASQKNPVGMEQLSADATLSEDGWVVKCWVDIPCIFNPPPDFHFDPGPVFHYLIDPVTGNILTKRVEKPASEQVNKGQS